jgi:hypothetical protein
MEAHRRREERGTRDVREALSKEPDVGVRSITDTIFAHINTITFDSMDETLK